MSKRFYLCNLIPLWKIDLAHLEVDWTQEEARDGEVVELRAVVKIPLNLQQPNFSVQFEINESDYLLFGGLDDHVVTIGSQPGDGVEHRPFTVLDEADPVPDDQQLQRIFVSPMPAQEGTPHTLIRTYWRAEWRDDVSGNPEYYFDFEMRVEGVPHKERAERELVVSAGAVDNAAAGAGGADGAALQLPALGWTQERVFPGEEATRFALLAEDTVGQPLTFIITPEQGGALWIMLVPEFDPTVTPGTDISQPWRVPVFLPLEGITSLNLQARINEETYPARDVAAIQGHEGLALHQHLRLRAGRPEQELPAGMDAAEQRLQTTDLINGNAALKALRNNLQNTLAAWNSPTGFSTDPQSCDYAFALQEFAYSHVRNNDTLLPRPASAGQRAQWERKFREIHVLALMILIAGNHVEQREDRAALIAIDLVEAGFLNEAITLAQLFSERADQETIYKKTIKQLGKIPQTQLPLVIAFFSAESDSIANHKIVEALNVRGGGRIDDHERLLPDGTHAIVQALGSTDNQRNEKLQVIFDNFITNYSNDPDLVFVLATLLFFQRLFRAPFSEQMWRDGKEYLLFKILTAEEFTEPDYGAPRLDNVRMTMNDDMPWVYENKQRYFVRYLVRLGQKGGNAIPDPANLRFNTLRAWIEDHTNTVGRSLATVYPDQPNTWIWGYEQITDIFFFHVDRGDVEPDLSGHIGHLLPSDPNNLRIRADCDVFATYGARLLQQCGFTVVGYMGIWDILPGSQLGIGHAGVLLIRNGTYYELNNKEVIELDSDDEAAAIEELRGGVLDILNDPDNYRVYYVPAEANGAMSQGLLDQDPALRRENLEP